MDQSQEARFAKLAELRRERELSELGVKLFKLQREAFGLELRKPDDWRIFKEEFWPILQRLVDMNMFEEKPELLEECKALLTQPAVTIANAALASKLASRVYNFLFIEKAVAIKSKLP